MLDEKFPKLALDIPETFQDGKSLDTGQMPGEGI